MLDSWVFDSVGSWSRNLEHLKPIFGILKAAVGFRAFRLRGLAGAATEWTLVTLAYNLRRLHRLGAKLKTTPAAA